VGRLGFAGTDSAGQEQHVGCKTLRGFSLISPGGSPSLARERTRPCPPTKKACCRNTQAA
jgi:hypothetical protein